MLGDRTEEYSGVNELGLQLWPLLVPLLIYLPGIIGKIPFASSQSEFSDLLVSHYPNALLIKNTIIKYQVIPLWSPAVFSGTPFAADPLAGLWYPGGWPALLFPLPGGISLMVAVHLLGAGIGCYLYLRTLRIKQEAAIFGAAGLMLLPKTTSHYGAGHISLIYAFCWTPWLLLAVRKAKSWFVEAVILALIFTADPRWVVFAGAVWVVYRIAHRHESWWKMIVSGIKVVLTSILLAAPLVFPLLEFARQSTRKGMTTLDVFAHSLPWEQLLGLFYPKGNANPEWEVYLGGMIFLLVLLSLTLKNKDLVFWWTIGLLSLGWGLGDVVHGADLAANLPGFSLLRVPPRSLFITGFSAVVIASLSLDALFKGTIDQKRGNLLLAGGTALALSFNVALGNLMNKFPVNLIWGITIISLSFIALSLVQMRKIPASLFFPLLLVVTMVDGIGTGYINVDYRALNYGEKESNQVVEFLEAKDGIFRVYSPTYSHPQHLAVENNLELAEGVAPLHLQRYKKYLAGAADFAEEGYSVTLPPFPAGDPAQLEQEPELDLIKMGLLNIKYISSEVPLTESNIELVDQIGDTWIYHNPLYFPRVWLTRVESNLTRLDEVDPEIMDGVGEILDRNPNRMVIKIEGPGRLILSEISYPGWAVRLDGKKTEYFEAFSLFRAVDIPPGNHIVEFNFKPLSVYLGVGVSIVTLILIFCWRKNSEQRV